MTIFLSTQTSNISLCNKLDFNNCNRFVYYNRDPRVTNECGLNLYRTSIESFRFKPFDIMKVESEEVIVTKKELLNFLEDYIEFDKRVEHLADEIELNNVVYSEIIFSPQHDYIAFFFDLYNDGQ